jgi:diaminopropionate ammonia-lyase
MSTVTSRPYLNPAARRWRTAPLQESPAAFHRSLPGSAPTRLTPLPALARELGVGAVLVKDESSRLGLPAFKILGASYAIARALAARHGAEGASTWEALRDLAVESGRPTLVAATDGNHGRAVAHVARLLGIPATVLVPAGISAEAKAAIVGEGAELVELDLPYDDVVARAAERCGEQDLLIQDTTWEGYAEIPRWIVDGYATLLDEVDEQLAAQGADRPDLVVVPAGVGSLAQAVVHHYRSTAHAPALLAVEPDAAPSVTAALRAGRIVPVETGETVMTGLNCGTVSEIAWPTLREGLDAAVTVTDREALAAAADLAGLGVDSGPCGAATLAGLRTVLAEPGTRERLELTEDSVVVLLSTEGTAANPRGVEGPSES